MATATDDFNRSNANTLGSNWSAAKGYPTAIRCAIVSNSAGYSPDLSEGNPELSDYYSATAFGADQFSQATVVELGAYTTAVTVRSITSGTAKAVYCGGANPGEINGVLRIWKMNPSFTSIAAHASETLAVGNVLKLTVEGTALKLYINGVEKVSTTDSALSAGQPGIALYDDAYSTAIFDDWSGGDLTVARNPVAMGFVLE